MVTDTTVHTIPVAEEHIAAGRLGIMMNPISLALADAFGLSLVAVGRGPGMTPFYEARTAPSGYELMTTWNASLPEPTPGIGRGIAVHDVPLPRQCQYFLNAWESGPQSGPWAIKNSAGEVKARLTYCEIIRPFCFPLELSFSPAQLPARLPEAADELTSYDAGRVMMPAEL